MEIILALLIALGGMAIMAAFWAWILMHAVNFVVHIKPSFWQTCIAFFFASLIGSVSMFLVNIRLPITAQSLGHISLAHLVLYFIVTAACFRSFLKTPTGERIRYKHSMTVILIPTLVNGSFIFWT